MLSRLTAGDQGRSVARKILLARVRGIPIRPLSPGREVRGGER